MWQYLQEEGRRCYTGRQAKILNHQDLNLLLLFFKMQTHLAELTENVFEDVAWSVEQEGLQSWQEGALLQDGLQRRLTLKLSQAALHDAFQSSNKQKVYTQPEENTKYVLLVDLGTLQVAQTPG